jgi:membrane-bound ClpP family serine protease
MLLLTLLFDDIFGGVLGALHIGFDVAGVSPTPMLLGFISMFGVGGLLGAHGLGLGVGGATVSGVVAGLFGSVVVFGAFKVLRQAESTDTFSLQDMIGSPARVSVAIPANRYGSVLISFAGTTHNMTATADADIRAGQEVKVVGVAGTNLVVAAASVAANEGGSGV